MYQDAWLQCFILGHFSSSLRMAPGPCPPQQCRDHGDRFRSSIAALAQGYRDTSHNLVSAYVAVRSCAALAAFALALLSQHNTTCLFDIHPTVYQGPSTPCIFPSKLEHLAVELYSSTFLNTQTLKTWSILSQGVFYWLEWGHHSQKLVRLFWHSRQLANIHSPSFSLYATRSAYGGVWERWAGKIIVKMLLETRPSSGVSSTALKSEDKGQTHTRSPSLHCKFSWRESESAILWKSAGVCQ